MKNMLLGLVAASFLAIMSGCAGTENDDDSTAETTSEPAVVTVEDDTAAPNMMKPPRVFYTPRVTRSDILAGGGSCASSLCTLGGASYQCSGPGTCTYLGSSH